MRVDRRHYVRDLAPAATLFGALGLNSAAYAQKSQRLCKYQKIQSSSWIRRGPSRCRLRGPINGRTRMMTCVFFALAFMLSTVIGYGSPVVAAPGQGVSEDTIAARERFFGAENVDERSGEVRADRVIFSWVTNASLAVSIRGRIVLLDTYINRPELPPAAGAADLRRSPISVQELVALAPEAIFLGHGHGDHADNAAYIAKQLNIPIYSSPETCDAMQADVQRMFADPNLVNGGVRIIPNNLPVNCISPITRGSVPGAEVVNIHQLDPAACIVSFKHIHSGHGADRSDFPIHSGLSRFRSARTHGKCGSADLLSDALSAPLSQADEPDAEPHAGSRTDELEDNWRRRRTDQYLLSVHSGRRE